jgi:hypothetical protein
MSVELFIKRSVVVDFFYKIILLCYILPEDG